MATEHDEFGPRQERKLLRGLMGVCGLFLAVGVVGGSEPGAGRTLALGDLSEAHIVEIRDADGRTMLSGEFRKVTDPSGDIERDAALTDRGGRNVIGEVEIDIPGANASNRRQELEIDIIRLASRATFTVVIDDRAVAAFTTDDRGSIDLEIESAPPGHVAIDRTEFPRRATSSPNRRAHHSIERDPGGLAIASLKHIRLLF